MKKLFLLLCLIITINSQGQDRYFLNLWEEYDEYCHQIQKDTLTEYGTVRYSVRFEKDVAQLVAIDTTWNEMECKEYEYDYEHDYSYFGTSTYHSGSITWDNSNVTLATWGSYSEPDKSQIEAVIQRKKYCNYYLEKPSPIGFFKWLKQENYIKR